MAVTLNDVAEYLRLPPDNAESLKIYRDAAMSQLRSAGVPRYENNADYDLAVMALAAWHYDNRGMANAESGSDEAFQRMLNSLVLRLRYAKDDPEGMTDCCDDGECEDKLRAKAKSLGVTPHHASGKARIKRDIEAAENSKEEVDSNE